MQKLFSFRMVLIALLVGLVFVLFGKGGFAEYCPVVKPVITFEKALELAREQLKKEHAAKHKILSTVPLDDYIVVRAVYGTKDKPFDQIEPDAETKGDWGWTFELANYKDTSISAIIHVVDEKKVTLVEVTT